MIELDNPKNQRKEVRNEQNVSQTDRTTDERQWTVHHDDYTLSLIRNEIFARHGYVFKKEEYRNYFNSMPWYTPNPSFSGSVNDLNSIEKYNVELIKSLE